MNIKWKNNHMSITQYLKDTRTELRHVAWPTRTQTIIYTVLVAAISVGVALYLGLFDFLFTTGLAHVVNNLPSQNAAPAAQQQTQPLVQGNGLTITPATSTQQ
jgi:preprotein translocase SecE subunit